MASFYGKIEIYLNDTNGNFNFLERINHAEGYYSFEIKDYDLDNDLDIFINTNGKVDLYENNQTNWAQYNLLTVDSESTISGLKIADIDDNGKFDVAVLEDYYDVDYNEFSSLTIYNDIVAGSFSDTTVFLDTTSITHFEFVDMDQDNKLDMAFVKFDFFNLVNVSPNIGWFSNTEILDNIINSDNSNLQIDPDLVSLINRNILFENIDADDQKEILITNTKKSLKDQLTRFDGTPLNENFPESILYESIIETINYDKTPLILSGDLNGDGKNDIVQKIDAGQYAIFFHNGIDNLTQTPVLIDINSSELLDFKLFGLMDKENDGDLDIYSSFEFNDGWRLVWLLNDGTGVFSSFDYIENTPYASVDGYKNMLIGDIDGDSDDDLVAYSDDAILWYKNLGSGNYGTANTVQYSDEFDELNAELVDLDGDGNLELFAFYGKVPCGSHFCFYTKGFYIYDLNATSNQLELIQVLNSWPVEVYDGTFEGELGNSFGFDIDFDIIYKDIDNDSNIDMVTIDADQGNLKVLFGDGLGNFDNEFIVMNDDLFKIQFDFYTSIYKVGLYLNDIDGDGDLDIVFLKSSVSDGGIYLIENKEIDLGVDGDEDGIALVYDCDDSNANILDALDLPLIETTWLNCVGDNIQLDIQNEENYLEYSWSTPNGIIEMPNFDISSAALSDNGTYTVQSFLNQCESEINEVEISVAAYPVLTLEMVGDTLQIVSNDEGLTVQWFLNGNEMIGENDDYILPTETGDYHVVVSNTNGCESTTEEFPFFVSGVLSNAYAQLEVYPNPVKSNGFLQLNNFAVQGSSLAYQITNVSGQTLQVGTIERSGLIQINQLSKGTYILTLQNEDQKMVGHFMVVE